MTLNNSGVASGNVPASSLVVCETVVPSPTFTTQTMPNEEGKKDRISCLRHAH